MTTAAPRRFTGLHMTLILVAFFGVVIGVNLYMSRMAISTFGGVVVENSYVASQHFNRWLDEAAKEKALGWKAEAKRLPDGRVSVDVQGLKDSGLAENKASLSAIARHPLGRLPDQTLAFTRTASGAYVSSQPLPAGRWRLRLEITANGHRWRSEEAI